MSKPTPQATILVIDDEKNLQFGLQTVLQRAGYDVQIADNGSMALALIRSTPPDLIICDVMMPAPNGIDLFRILSQTPATAAIPFLLLTARSAPADRLFGLELGVDEYMTKPFDVRELLLRVRNLLRRRQLNQTEGYDKATRQMNDWSPTNTNVVIRNLLRREYQAKGPDGDTGGQPPPASP